MRVLLDECVPGPLHKYFTAYPVSSVKLMGWQGKKNGVLLSLMKEHGFTILITIDQNMRYQQNLSAAGIALIVIKARSNKTKYLLPAIPQVYATLNTIGVGDVIEIDA